MTPNDKDSSSKAMLRCRHRHLHILPAHPIKPIVAYVSEFHVSTFCSSVLLELCPLSGGGVQEHSAICRRTHSTQIINMLLAKNAYIFRCYCQANTQADTRTLTRFWSGRAQDESARYTSAFLMDESERERQTEWRMGRGDELRCRIVAVLWIQHSDYQLALTLHWQTALHSRSAHIVIITRFKQQSY